MDPQITSDMVVDNDFDEKQDVAIITPDDSMDDAEPEPVISADDFEAMKKRHMPELPDLEVEAEAEHTWDIEGWRSMLRREHGPVFQCGGSPWRVLFFPYGNNVDHASFYLEHGFEDKPPEDWYACVQFMLVLWNPNDPTLFISHTATHRFTADEGDWGFTRFAELRKIFASRFEDRDRPLVEGNSARMTAYVRIVKDPTGVLWHNFINYDSKKETGMVGLKNQGATCYLNSLLQSLYFTTAFRKAVYQIPTEHESDFRANSAYALQRLFYQLQTSYHAVPTHELTGAFGWDSKQIFEQQDVQELSRVLMERLEEKMKGTEAENALPKLFVGKTKTYISCINVKYESSRIEDFWDIQLNVSGNKTLDDSFKDYIQKEIMKDDNKYFAEGYGLQEAEKGVIFESFPSVLHLQLKRFEYDYQRDTMMKINDRYEFPEIWDATPYLSDDADRSEPYVYHLHGVLVHSGDLNAGHYYAFLKPVKNGDFFKFDDDRVTRATRKEAIDENFGGEYGPLPNGNTAQRNPYTRTWSSKRSNNAYMLVYIRESRLDEVLLSEEDVEPPVHLAQKFAEERALMEKRRKEREEAHLYMDVLVATEENFKAHQGFDLVQFKGESVLSNMPRPFRVKRDAKLGAFMADVAKDFQLDPEMVRPWAMVNRQNATVRPDQPIPSNELTVEEAALKYGTKSTNFRIWIETATEKDAQGKPIWGNTQVDPGAQQNNRPIVLFLKYFDIDAQLLRGIGHFYASPQDKVADIAPQILKLMDWPAGTAFKMFEEIKHNMIEPMKPKQTLAQSEIQDGDIVTVQKHLSEKEATALQSTGRYVEVREFYDYLLHKIKVKFASKLAPDAEETAFELTLSKRMNYNQFAQKVGEKLKVDPTHLRFYPVNASTGRAKIPIRHTTTQNLGTILAPGYNSYGANVNQRSDALYYEILEVSMAELEMRKSFKITWLPEGLLKEEHHEVLVPKNGTVADIIQALQRKAGLNDESTDRIRIYETHANKIFRDCQPNAPVANLSDYAQLIAEIMPEEDLDFGTEDMLIPAFHFEKDIGKTHGIPFVFLVKHGESFKDAKERISKRTGLKGKQFEKIKFAVVQRSAYQKPEYLEDDDILSEKLLNRDDMLGLDHPNKNKTGWIKADSIFIR